MFLSCADDLPSGGGKTQVDNPLFQEGHAPVTTPVEANNPVDASGSEIGDNGGLPSQPTGQAAHEDEATQDDEYLMISDPDPRNEDSLDLKGAEAVVVTLPTNATAPRPAYIEIVHPTDLPAVDTTARRPEKRSAYIEIVHPADIPAVGDTGDSTKPDTANEAGAVAADSTKPDAANEAADSTKPDAANEAGAEAADSTKPDTANEAVPSKDNTQGTEDADDEPDVMSTLLAAALQGEVDRQIASDTARIETSDTDFPPVGADALRKDSNAYVDLQNHASPHASAAGLDISRSSSAPATAGFRVALSEQGSRMHSLQACAESDDELDFSHTDDGKEERFPLKVQRRSSRTARNKRYSRDLSGVSTPHHNMALLLQNGANNRDVRLCFASQPASRVLGARCWVQNTSRIQDLQKKKITPSHL